jgi:hypothetical protein
MPKYSVGIDLGTTHSAVSTFDLSRDKGRGAEQQMLSIPQLIKPGALEEPFLLPSFLYLPNENEFPAESLNLPWKSKSNFIVGEFARAHGAKVPTRLVSSAKSWLCHPAVDRRATILPWQAPPDVQRVSPLEASTRYLQHLRSAWEFKTNDSLKDQTVVLTVPASFDASARDLTTEAATQAGLEGVVLLEEPQAALYAWIEAMGESFRKELTVGDVILVIDVGGGTTDFSLIAVTEQSGDVQLTRLAVGDHILLGGDNMDLALAHTLNQQLAADGKKLDAWQFASLTYACREGKERLFGDTKAKKHPIAIASRGSALIGGTVKTELDRERLESVLVEGFFPSVTAGDTPQVARRIGLTQMSLPYAQDAAVTRHLAAFLTRQAAALAKATELPDRLPLLGGRSFVHPTAILFNGGVFKAAPLKTRVLEVVNSWLASEGGPPVKELSGADLDLSVARGAAYYGWVRQGHGIRIRGGTAHAYYVGVEASVPAVPGFEPPLRALCVAPFGMEEGTKAEIPPQEFGLVVGEPTRFRFFSSSVRREDRPGEMVEDAAHNPDLEEVSPVETTLPGTSGQLVPVNLQAAVTELGTLELQCLEKSGAGSWKLELNVRMKD